MKKIKEILMSVAIVGGMLTGAATVTVAVANASPASEIIGGADTTGQNGGKSLQENIKIIVDIILFIIGTIAVIMIVVGGLRYTLSGGDANAVKGAKDTILYAIVGLIVAVVAYAIVHFVLKQFVGDGSGN